MGILSAAERFASFDHSAVVLDRTQCLYSQDRFSKCELCWDICPSNAITRGTPPTLNRDDCTNCKACLPVCPVGAFQGTDSVKDLLTCLTRIETDAVELLCQENEQKSIGIKEGSTGVAFKGCLAGLGVGTVITIFSLGIKKVYLRLEACQSCKWKTLKPSIDKQVEQAKRILGAWNQSENLIPIEILEDAHERPCWDAHNAPLTRRDLFRLATRQGTATLAQAVEHSNHKTHLPGRDRRRMINSMHQFPNPVNDLTLSNEETFGNLSVSETCTACGTCARACPTEAVLISINKEEKQFKLTFNPKLCIACGICANVCLPSSITLLKSIPLQEVFFEGKEMVLREGSLSKCEKCGSFFASKPDTYVCPTCANRRKNPFGSIVPPGLERNSTKSEKSL